jgi:hypothetical protein
MADQRENDRRIKEVLAKYDELLASNVWRVQGTAVIYHKTLERIAVKAKITFDEPKIIRAERDEAVMQVTGRMGDRVEWSIGEALVGTNYRVSGKQAAYVWAMAEKRAKDRVILKLIELAGMVYSEEEADEFKRAGTRGEVVEDTTEHDEDGVVQQDPPPSDTSAVRGSTESGQEAYSGAARVGQKPEDSVAAKVKANIDRRETWEAVQEFMQAPNTKDAIDNRMTQEEAKEVTDHALARMAALGWKPKGKGKSEDPSSRKAGGVVPEDPYHPINLNTLPTRIGTAIVNAKTVQEMEDLFDACLTDQGINWDSLPEEVQAKLNEVADKKAAAIKKKTK